MLDPRLLEILVCPADRGPLFSVDGGAGLYNPRLRKLYRVEDGIPVLLVGEAVDIAAEQHERWMNQPG